MVVNKSGSVRAWLCYLATSAASEVVFSIMKVVLSKAENGSKAPRTYSLLVELGTFFVYSVKPRTD
jgi:hypothetical protein